MGFEVLNACFDAALPATAHHRFGEDVGQLGDVNQGFRGMQEKYGPLRVSDTASARRRSWARPSAWPCAGCARLPRSSISITCSTPANHQRRLANLSWRTAGGQKAPVIIAPAAPAGGQSGTRLADGWHLGASARHLPTRPARHDARRWFLQHPAPVGRTAIVVEVLNAIVRKSACR